MSIVHTVRRILYMYVIYKYKPNDWGINAQFKPPDLKTWNFKQSSSLYNIGEQQGKIFSN